LDVNDINFNALLLLEPLHAAYLAQRLPDKAMGIALRAHPAVRWYLAQIYPPIKGYLERCLALAQTDPSAEDLRRAEIAVLNSMHDWLIYVLDPAKYDQLAFLKWDDSSLLSMANFTDKIVLDIGAGTGRLAFTIASQAHTVYAVEPVANLRRYLWEKRTRLGLENVFPCDGTITQIPFPDEFADIVIAGHVFGEHFEAEYNEMARVVRDGGMILLHPGTNAKENQAHSFLIDNGFNYDTFTEPTDGLKRKYWKTINKHHTLKEHTP
jgi:ubiquinone/menaquinone biosynthesis C-methylase UbiE